MKQIFVNNCYDCPYREENTGGKVPHYCKNPNIVCRAVADEDFENVCPLKELKTGHWTYREDVLDYECSKCGRVIQTYRFENPYIRYPYCHCGAKMVKSQKSEE